MLYFYIFKKKFILEAKCNYETRYFICYLFGFLILFYIYGQV